MAASQGDGVEPTAEKWYMSSTILDYVKGEIASNKVVLFTKTFCPYCKNAIALFEGIKVDFKVIPLDTREDGPQIQSELAALSGQKTVPNVWIGGKHVGGFSETKSELEKGTLATRLKEAGVSFSTLSPRL